MCTLWLGASANDVQARNCTMAGWTNHHDHTFDAVRERIVTALLPVIRRLRLFAQPS